MVVMEGFNHPLILFKKKYKSDQRENEVLGIDRNKNVGGSIKIDERQCNTTSMSNSIFASVRKSWKISFRLHILYAKQVLLNNQLLYHQLLQHKKKIDVLLENVGGDFFYINPNI